MSQINVFLIRSPPNFANKSKTVSRSFKRGNPLKQVHLLSKKLAEQTHINTDSSPTSISGCLDLLATCSSSGLPRVISADAAPHADLQVKVKSISDTVFTSGPQSLLATCSRCGTPRVSVPFRRADAVSYTGNHYKLKPKGKPRCRWKKIVLYQIR